MECEGRLNSADLGNKTKLITRNRFDDSIQEFDRTLQSHGGVKWREAAREKLTGRTRFGKSDNLVSGTVLQDKNAIESGFSWRGEGGFAVPWRSIHPQLAIVQAQNDAIVAENFGTSIRLPESGGGALACAGVAEK